MKPKNEREKVLYRLDKTYDWEKVQELNLAEINEETFIPLLHDIDADKMDVFIRKMDQDQRKREREKVEEISTSEWKLVEG